MTSSCRPTTVSSATATTTATATATTGSARVGLARLLVVVALLAALGTLGPGAGHAVAADVGVDPVGVWPLDPEPAVVRPFDPPEHAYGAGHRGVDLAGRAGQPVRSALPGTVTFAGSLAGRGVVVVSHGPTRTTYEPVTATVGKGDAVAAGAVLGVLQVSSSHCFPAACLHWGWIEGETYLDPLRLVGGGPVRLLPLWGDRPVATASVAPLAAVAPLAPIAPMAAVALSAAQARGWAWR